MTTEADLVQEQNKTLRMPPDWWVRGVLAIVLVVWAFWFCKAYSIAKTVLAGKAISPMEVFGQLGDSFGALNVLFTSLAFVAVWWTGRMQKEVLILQKNELELQRAELKATRDVMGRESFESMFFQTLKLSRELHSEIKYYRNPALRGSDAVEYLVEDCHGVFTHMEGRVLAGQNEAARERFGQLFVERVYRPNMSTLGPYFRTLYYTVKLIDRQPTFTDTEKKDYSRLARAQLGSGDLIVLAANGCTDLAGDFKTYIEHYALLKHLPEGAFKEFITRCYDPSAFGVGDD